MTISIEIPAALSGIIMSLEVQELDDDKILDEIGNSDHVWELISFGLINCAMNDDEEEEYFLTRLGKLVHEQRGKKLKP